MVNSFTPIVAQIILRIMDTKIQHLLLRKEPERICIGSAKRILLGDIRLRLLGVDRIEIHRVKGSEPLVRFIRPQNEKGISQAESFLQKSEINQIKAFIKVLKDCNKKGVIPDFSLTRTALRYVQ